MKSSIHCQSVIICGIYDISKTVGNFNTSKFDKYIQDSTVLSFPPFTRQVTCTPRCVFGCQKCLQNIKANKHHINVFFLVIK